MSLYTLLVFLSVLCVGYSLNCYTCTADDLSTCKRMSLKCRPEQNRCLNLLLEGGEVGTTYIKRCARANECDQANLENMCLSKKSITQTGQCRPSCCEVDNCNHGNRYFASWLTIAMAILVGLKVAFW